MRVFFHLQVLRNLVRIILVHRSDDFRVLSEFDPCTFQSVDKLVSEFRLAAEHVGVLVQKLLDSLNQVLFTGSFQELRCDVLGSLVSAIDFLFGQPFLDTIISEHVALSSVDDLSEDVLERIVSSLNSCTSQSERLRASFELLSLLLTMLLDVSNWII